MKDPERPNPDNLLRRYGLTGRGQVGGRGRLRVYLGAAPGVGKTYTMLGEGRRRKAEGHDIVVGLVEAHGRAETEAQLGDLEIIPRRQIDYRGVTIEEMDVDAVVRRKPDIVLVDELAHTNAPGSPRAKRWEDVETLRDAGIDVISTLNIQHVESLNHVVESITGVTVRETIPDHILDDATEVQLVDLPVEGLLERLERGKIYPAQRASQALEHYFRAGNLTALRELALRRTAAGVDDQLESYMRGHAIQDVWGAAERILVVIPIHPDNGRVIRNAWRLAGGLRAELIAAAIVPPGGLEAMHSDHRLMLQRGLDLAEDLGATLRVIEGNDLAEVLASGARDENASTVVMGYIPETGWRRRRRPSIVEQIFQRLDHVNIHLVELSNIG